MTKKQQRYILFCFLIIVAAITMGICTLKYFETSAIEQKKEEIKSVIAFSHPEFEKEYQANKQALDELNEDISNLFNGYKERVPAFTDDITGWGNKFTIIGKTISSWTSDDKEKAKRHVTEKFYLHVVDEKKMEDDITSATEAFFKKVERNRNILRSDLIAVFENNLMDELRAKILTDDFTNSWDSKTDELIEKASKDMGNQAAILTAASVVTGIGVEEITRIIVTTIVARIAVAASTSAASAGGATVAGTAGGGAAGSVVPVVGTGVGIAVGFVAGAVVDYFMTEKLKDNLQNECTNALTTIEKSFTDKEDSLSSRLTKELELYSKASEESLESQLLLYNENNK